MIIGDMPEGGSPDHSFSIQKPHFLKRILHMGKAAPTSPIDAKLSEYLDVVGKQARGKAERQAVEQNASLRREAEARKQREAEAISRFDSTMAERREQLAAEERERTAAIARQRTEKEAAMIARIQSKIDALKQPEPTGSASPPGESPQPTR